MQYPMVQQTLVNLAVRWRGATLLAFEAAFTLDKALNEAARSPWLRLSKALSKYLTAVLAS